VLVAALDEVFGPGGFSSPATEEIEEHTTEHSSRRGEKRNASRM
jgi:hypothetical protein